VEWVVLELSSRGEGEDPEPLRAALERSLKGVEFFVPVSVSTVGESRVIHWLVDGYVFAKRTVPDSSFFRLENTRYINSILTSVEPRGGRPQRVIAPVPDADIEKMRRQIRVETQQGIEVGDEVEVTSGPYRGIKGRIIEEVAEQNTVQVYIQLRSKKAIVTLPRSFLKFVAKDTTELPVFSPFATKIARVREWARLVRPVLSWAPRDLSPLRAGLAKVTRLDGWVKSLARVYGFVQAFQRPLDPAPLRVQLEHVAKLARWQEKAAELTRAYRLSHYNPSTEALEKKLLEVQWLNDTVARAERLTAEVEAIERQLLASKMKRKPPVTENVIVDGHQLAFRIVEALNSAPGGSKLMDGQGRPTGLYNGFLRSLGALRTRFPGAKLYVSWDGSSQRRRALCESYKANRPSREVPQLPELWDILSAVGVWQVHNPEEETDDLIACLVRGPLQGQRNVIVSTDRDFLQLVTPTDILLCPKVGKGEEKIYDPDKVTEEYGVAPSAMVYLRALRGDSSDNLPGVPRVPTDVLASLVRAHGTVEAIFASNLAGLTPNQYGKVRAAEAQVRLNVLLMTLRYDLSYRTMDATPDLEKAASLLTGYGIQAEPVLKPFFETSKGFRKTS
jgi:5'-3' exonuclease/transcription antitermination factor NusG